jgi:hypothetical protein
MLTATYLCDKINHVYYRTDEFNYKNKKYIDE